MFNITATTAATTHLYAAAEAAWLDAVNTRDEFDARRREEYARPNVRVENLRRRDGARRAHMTRRIIAAEAAIDRLRSVPQAA